MLDNAVAIAEGIAELEFDAVERKQPDRARDLLRLMKDAGVHPWSVQPKLRALLSCLAAKPTVREVAHGSVAGRWPLSQRGSWEARQILPPPTTPLTPAENRPGYSP